MSDIVLSSATRANLLALQNTTSLQGVVQNRLATGKKVNSALDNATNFFTAANFTNRSTSLTSLLDSMSTGVQTMQAANNGITSITKLVAQLRSTAQQALQSTGAFLSNAKVTSTSAVAGATAADLRGTAPAAAGSATATSSLSALTSGTKAAATSANQFASSVVNYSPATATSTGDFSTLADTVVATASATSATDFSSLSSGSSQIRLGATGGQIDTLTYDTTAGPGDNTKFASVSDLNNKLIALGNKVRVDTSAGGKVTFKSVDTSVAAISVDNGSGGAILAGVATSATRTDGAAIRVSDGTTTTTVYKDTSGNRPSSFTNASTLNSRLSAAGVNVSAALGGSGGTKLVLTGTGTANITVDNGSGGAVLGLGTTAYNHVDASTLSINDGTGTRTYTYDSAAAAGDPTKFNSIGDLNTKLAAANVKVKATNAGGALKLTGTDYTTNITIGGSLQTAAGLATSATATAGSILTLSDGTTTKTYTYDTSATGSDVTSFATVSDLGTKVTADGLKATATAGAGGNLKLSATDSTTTLSVGGTAQSGLGFGTTIAPTAGAAALQGKTLTFATSSGATTTVTFGDPATTPGSIKTLDDLNSKISSIGLSATIDGNGVFTFSTTAQTASQTFSISGTGTGTGTSFTTTASTTVTRGGTGADARDGFIVQYNNLLDQIDTLSKDAGFNGINLLAGDTLSLIFNETNTSRLDVAGTLASSSGLGLNKVSAQNFNDGDALNAVLSNVDRVSTQLSTQASRLGSNLAVMQTRQDFTKQMVNTLKVGSDNLVNADLNEEGANLLALNTQQQLSQQALSLATQSSQSVLQLLRG